MDLDLSTYVFHYDKKKNSSLNPSFLRLWLRNHILIGECATTRRHAAGVESISYDFFNLLSCGQAIL